MATILDCIERIPFVIEEILKGQEKAYENFMEYMKERWGMVNEVVLIGSGTSGTAAATSLAFVEKTSGLPAKAVFPNDYIKEGRVYNPHALHVFTSQTGTSRVVCQLMEYLRDAGYWCIAFTEAEDTRLARISPCHICLNCGKEEFGMRTIGYAASVLNHMLLGMKIGVARKHLSTEQYELYQKQAQAVPDSHKEITGQTKKWFEKNKLQIMSSQCVIFTGAGALYGVAQEAAVKFWEMPQVISMGYELEEGLHGPNYGYNGNHCVVVLNDGGCESEKALSLARFCKEALHNGLVAGCKVVDKSDLLLDIRGGAFSCLEFSAVPQIMAYFLATGKGRDISRPIDHTQMYSYFSTHD